MKKFLEIAPQAFVTTLVGGIALAIYAASILGEISQGAPIPSEFFGGGTPELYWKGEWWRLPINTLLHGGFFHLLFNVYWLWILGSAAERSIGSLRYGLFIFGAMCFTTAASQLAFEPAIGLSGVVFAIVGLCFFLRRRYTLCAEALTPPIIKFAIIWLFLCILLTVSGMLPIANVAHFSGIAYGLAGGWCYMHNFKRRPWPLPLFIAGHLMLIPAWMYIHKPVYNPDYYFYLGVNSKVPVTESIDYYLNALRLRPDFPEAHFNTALIASMRKDYELALEHADAFLKADLDSLRLNDRIDDALGYKIEALVGLQRYGEALVAIDRLGKIDPVLADKLRNALGLPAEDGQSLGEKLIDILNPENPKRNEV